MMPKKKLIYIFICIAIIVTAAIAVPLAILLPKDKPLKLETKDYSLTVGEVEKLEFSITNPYAVVTYKISNEEALSIDNSNYMHAHKIGLVTITIKAKFKNEEVSATSLITITDLNNQPSNEETTASKPDNKNQDGENKSSENDNQPNTKDETTNNNDNDKNFSGENQNPNTENDNQHTEDKNEGGEQDNNPNINNEFFNFTLSANFGCEIRSNKIFVKKNQLANFLISIDILNEYMHDEAFDYEIVGKGISRNLDGLGWNILTDKDIVAKIMISGKEVDEILIFVED